MLSKKPPKRLFKNKDVIHAYQHDRATKTAFKSMTRDHIDVLQNIESTLVRESRNDPRIDDVTIDQALGSCIDQTELSDHADPRLVHLCKMLETLRTLREDVTDELWLAGLRTVRKSVRTHSSLAPGDTGYLNFVRPYVR
jgi:hypothetical protein